MRIDSIVELAARFESGQLSGDEYLRLVDLERTVSLPPVRCENRPYSSRN